MQMVHVVHAGQVSMKQSLHLEHFSRIRPSLSLVQSLHEIVAQTDVLSHSLLGT